MATPGCKKTSVGVGVAAAVFLVIAIVLYIVAFVVYKCPKPSISPTGASIMSGLPAGVRRGGPGRSIQGMNGMNATPAVVGGGTTQSPSHAKENQMYAKAMQAARVSESAAACGAQGTPAPKVMAPDQTGMLASVLASHSGDSLLHMAPTSIAATGVPGDMSSSMSDLAYFDPEANEQIERALSLSTMPESFHMSEGEEIARKRDQIAKNMMLAGHPNPTIEDVLATSTPFIATNSMLKRALAAQGDLRSVILPTPLSKVWQNPPERGATVQPTISPIVQDNMPVGLQNYLINKQCGTSGLPITMEPL